MSLIQKILLALAGLAFAVAVPATALAAVNPFEQACTGGGSGSSICQNGGADPLTGPQGAIVNVTTILAVVAGVVATIFFVWGAMKYITSGGDSSGVSTAKQTMLAALIGLVIAVLARPIITFVIGKL